MVISGVALGICIGNNTDFGGGVPNHKANNGILVLKKLPDVSNNGYTSEGFVEEELYRNLNPNGDGTAYMTEVWMYAYREVTHDTEWVDGTVIQTYLQIEDPNEVGAYLAFTCTAVYNKDAAFSQDVKVQNYRGEVSITVADMPDVKWDDFGDAPLSEPAFWEDDKHMRYSYASIAHDG